MVIPSVGTTDSTSALHRIAAAERTATATHHRLSKRQLMDLSAVLELWLDENHGNLYPTRHQKERIALDTSMSYNQVNRWFANRRRKQQLQCEQYDMITPSGTPQTENDVNVCDTEPATPSSSVDACSSVMLSLSTTSSQQLHNTPTTTVAADANNNTSNNNNNNNSNNNSTEATAKLYNTMYLNWLEATTAWAHHSSQVVPNLLSSVAQQHQPQPTAAQQFFLDSLLFQQQKSPSAAADTLLFSGGKQKLALLDAHNLTEKEHLAVSALADLANHIY